MQTQKLLFSATLSRDPAKIAALHLHRPIYISVEDPPAIDEDGDDEEKEEEEVDEEMKFTLPAGLSVRLPLLSLLLSLRCWTRR